MLSSIATSNWWVHAVSQPAAGDGLAARPVRSLVRLMLTPLSGPVGRALARRRRFYESRRMEAEFARLAETSPHLLADIGIDRITHALPEHPATSRPSPDAVSVRTVIGVLLAPAQPQLRSGGPA